MCMWVKYIVILLHSMYDAILLYKCMHMNIYWHRLCVHGLLLLIYINFIFQAHCVWWYNYIYCFIYKVQMKSLPLIWQTMSHNALECSKILPEDVLVIVNVNIIISLSARPMLLYKFRSRLINTELPENEANVVIYNTNLCITVFLWAEVI